MTVKSGGPGSKNKLKTRLMQTIFFVSGSFSLEFNFNEISSLTYCC